MMKRWLAVWLLTMIGGSVASALEMPGMPKPDSTAFVMVAATCTGTHVGIHNGSYWVLTAEHCLGPTAVVPTIHDADGRFLGIATLVRRVDDVAMLKYVPTVSGLDVVPMGLDVPKAGELVWNVIVSNGGDYPLISFGVWTGELVTYDDHTFYGVTMPTFRGSSGGPIIYNGKVVAVTSLGYHYGDPSKTHTEWSGVSLLRATLGKYP